MTAAPDSFAPGNPEAAERAVALLKSMSHSGRLRILCCLLDHDRTVGELSATLAEPQPSVSQQLMRLRAEGLVTCARSGKSVTYRLASPHVTAIITALRHAFCPDDGT